MHILVVEDDVRLAQAIGRIMEDQQYTSELAYDGIDGLDKMTEGEYDLVILDVMLPGKDGFEVIKEARERKIYTPVLMLTAKDTTYDKVVGLEAGADDYLTKPFDTAELLARIRSLTRRTMDVSSLRLSFGNVSLDLDSGDIFCNNQSMHLSYKEFALMRIFLGTPNQPFTKEELIARVWGDDSVAEGNSVEAYISFLRKKLTFLKADVEIVTLRQVGYKLSLVEEK